MQEEARGVITIQARLTFETEADRRRVLDLMRRWSSCVRYAYNRLLEGHERNQLKRELQGIFSLNSRYVDDAIWKAKSILESCRERGENPRKVIFGGRLLFEKLRKRHIHGEAYRKLKIEWQERRKGHLYSRGDRTKKGNLNTRIEVDENGVRLRINVGERNYVYATLRAGWKKRGGICADRSQLLRDLSLSGAPYSVELKLKGGTIYACFTAQEPFPPPAITRSSGVIGIDLNAYPGNLSWAETDAHGQLMRYGEISLENLESGRQAKREHHRWQYAHEVIWIAKEKGKAIVVEKLRISNKGRRGDFSGRKSRRIRHAFGYRSLLEKIRLLAKRNGIEVVEVNPAYSSVIGMLKYAPQYMVSKDIAAAYVIARRGLGLKERIPSNYVKFLNDLDRGGLEELKEYVRKTVRNRYLRNQRMKEIDRLIQSLESEPGRTSRPLDGTSRGVRGESRNPWRILRVAVVTPLSPDRTFRNLSVLKPMLVSGHVGKPFRGRELLLPGAGARALPNAAFRGPGEPEQAAYKYPGQTVQNCTA